MPGRLIYVMGPSGAGKDTLLQGVMGLLASSGCQIARRVITRPVEASEPNTVPVTLTEFLQLEACGALAMAWRANGLAYGIPLEIDDRLSRGQDVLVNGSRAYLPEARKRYENLVAVLLTVDSNTLLARLKNRGRETDAQIQARMARNSLFDPLVCQADSTMGGSVFVVDNSGGIDQAVRSVALYLEKDRVCD